MNMQAEMKAGISSAAVLVDLNISIWTARKLDRSVSEEINAQKKTTVNAGNYSKNLLAGSVKLDEISKFGARMRLWHIQQTLPWADSGTRMLPMKNFMDYKAGLQARETTLRNMIDAFLQEYPTLVNNAATNLGALFNADDYPDVSEVAKKFRVACVFSPLPEAGDFRVDVEVDAMNELRDQFAQHCEDRVQEAMREKWNELHDALQHISERMTDARDTDGNRVRKKFRESVIDNPLELCTLLTRMNVTNDPKLEEARQDLERALVGLDVDDLREHESARDSLKEKVDAIIKKFDW